MGSYGVDERLGDGEWGSGLESRAARAEEDITEIVTTVAVTREDVRWRRGRVWLHWEPIARVACRGALPDTGFQSVQPGAGQHVDLPRLQISA